ncbi:aldehyde dehydrogenase family protein [Sulfitobacter geojensis]|jgi:acyl-CoA reductase-like NAD-dependent aldehyde dehydrogenase|uniref:Aldehyde dehydrogenase n=1 Tax=Sulfitobacter geojensis TaxID=1342299 RepID=A0AAE2W0T3_9RHOB|nr:aldehyde dehydrogenase family protein [Sulfitobacter geojensis]MBM1691153.1 aldehyde dehydrogenase [Sulfitobacter geojensis]MBM1695219.1 aldehyde dehydrogenase [Sulfitobacter geojensis]MBM1707319.1 aldehyde dehydrogenase [Sulfitobacter geojensis]MBM1711469.1 aldehyde dehydrogenase [Sulfitobacter geojensis]MBM1715444.1 aldehyde dehydrogenase [Sulfitobacter geojensis]
MDGSRITTFVDEYDAALNALDAAKDTWAQTDNAERIALLNQVKDNLKSVAKGWAETAARKKQIPEGSPLIGEEWTSGPYALMSGCNGFIQTLSGMEGKAYLEHLPKRLLPTGQTAVKVLPHSIWDHLLLSGVKAEVWMQKGVNAANLAKNAATIYDEPASQRQGKVALVLGAGNIASIAPLDVLQKLLIENQVVILKMNPVNDYLTDYLQTALKPFIDRDFVRIVKGDGAAGAYLTEHPIIEELHITGAASTHDAIVWGTGAEGEENRKAGTPKNNRRFTSELGAVCPTIVVPGPWSNADLKFQAEHIATQKLHNSGFNCVACQVLIMPKGWNKGETLMDNLRKVIAKSTRLAYYPGAADRLETFKGKAANVETVARGKAPAAIINSVDEADWFRENEVFAPAMSTLEMDAPDAESYLKAAIAYANDQLHGTLGANVLIHPKTIRKIGKNRFDEIIADLRYGAIAINAWTGLAFLATACPWGAFPGHTPEDVQSGIGTVHNTFMLENTERCVVQAPWSPFPRNLLSGSFTLLPRPPWFITNRKQDKVGELLTDFQYKPSWFKLPRIFLNALLG